MKDVADAAGVSLSTVSYVLSGVRPVSDATKRRVQDAIAKLDFHTNAAAAHLARRRALVIALVYPVLEQGISHTSKYFLRGAADQAGAAGYELVVWPSNDPVESVKLVKSGRADAVLLMEVGLTDPRVDALRENRIPFAMIGRTADDDAGAWVDVDFVETLRMAVADFTALGHRRIGFINNARADDSHRYGASARASAVFQQLTEQGTIIGHEILCEESPAAGKVALARLLEVDPEVTAILAMNEDALVGVLAGLHTLELKVPEDISILSLVTSPRMASMYSQPLSSYDVRGEESGRLGVDQLLAVIQEDRRPAGLLTQCDFSDRGSVAPAPHAVRNRRFHQIEGEQ